MQARITGRADPITEHVIGAERHSPHGPGPRARGFGSSAARAVRKSPARATPADERTWFPVPDVDSLPALEDLLEPHDLVAPRSLSTDGNVRPTPVRPRPTVYASPARALPADERAWFPVPNVDSLPELEELLTDDQLVNSGQTQAITDTQPRPVVMPPRRPFGPTRERGPTRQRAPQTAPAPKPARAPKPERAPKTASAPRAQRAPQRARRAKQQAAVHSHLRRRLIFVVLALVTAAALAFALPQILPHSPDVTIRVDGREISVQTDAHTVGTALRQHHVKVGANDRVTPRQSTKVRDGLNVDVFRAFPVVLDFDGQVGPIPTTWPKPTQLLRQLKLNPNKVSIVNAPTRLTQGATVVFRTLHQVTISVDGTQQTETTNALNVGEFLQQNGVVLNPEDQVTPPADTHLADAMTVGITRITEDTDTADEPMPPPTIQQKDPNLLVGQQEVVQQGAAGVQRVTYQITKKDGQEVFRSPISKVPIQPPTPTIIAVGTSLGPCGGATNGADRYINRESRGSPSAVNSSSGAYGCYQILPSTWAESCSDLGTMQGSTAATQAQCASRLPQSAWATG